VGSPLQPRKIDNQRSKIANQKIPIVRSLSAVVAFASLGKDSSAAFCPHSCPKAPLAYLFNLALFCIFHGVFYSVKDKIIFAAPTTGACNLYPHRSPKSIPYRSSPARGLRGFCLRFPAIAAKQGSYFQVLWSWVLGLKSCPA
jgi:hypothetical protein